MIKMLLKQKNVALRMQFQIRLLPQFQTFPLRHRKRREKKMYVRKVQSTKKAINTSTTTTIIKDFARCC